MSDFRLTRRALNVIALAVISLALTLSVAWPANAASVSSGSLPYAESSDRRFYSKGKPPSEHTLKVIRKARETMPFADKRDFKEAEMRWNRRSTTER